MQLLTVALVGFALQLHAVAATAVPADAAVAVETAAAVAAAAAEMVRPAQWGVMVDCLLLVLRWRSFRYLRIDRQ